MSREYYKYQKGPWRKKVPRPYYRCTKERIKLLRENDVEYFDNHRVRINAASLIM